MDISNLIQQCEPITHSERVKAMVDLGRKAKKDPTAEAVVYSLSRGSPFEQLLSLKTCHGSHDVGVAIHLLSSDSKYLKKQAINIIATLGSDAQLLDALKSGPQYLQRQTIHRIRTFSPRRKRPYLIESFLEYLKEMKDENLFKSLLPFGLKATVERYLPMVIDEFAPIDWSHLANFQPEIAQQQLYQLIKQSEERDAVVISTVKHVFTQWLSHDATVNFAYDLVRVALTKIPLQTFPIASMIRRRPIQTVIAILCSKDDLPIRVFGFRMERVFKKLPLSLFLSFFKRYPDIVESTTFYKLTAKQRLPVYEKTREAWRDDGALAWQLVGCLRTKERVEEARRTLRLKRFDTQPSDRIRYISLLPWDEAVTMQTKFLRSGEAEIRAEALNCQIKASKYNNARIEDALQLILSHKNEPGTVQREMFRALKEIPAARFKEDHFTLLTQIVRNALDTGDGVAFAISLIMDLVANFLSVNPRWAASQVALINKERGVVPGVVKLSGLVPVREVMAIVEEEMSPALQALLRKQDVLALSAFVRSFETYLKYWPGLLETCDKILEIPQMNDYHEMMIGVLYKSKQPPSFWPRIIALLTKENKAVAGSRHILNRIHRQLQNLLDPYIYPIPAPASYTRKRDALNMLRSGFWRWTPTQQEALAQIILKDVADEDVTSDKKRSYILQLGFLPYVDSKYLIQLASDERPIVQEAALKALGRMDGTQGIPLLIEALGDDRARIAIYALRSALRDLSKTEVFAILEAVPQRKVTVAKEKVRLIGELETEEALQWLLEAEKTKLHASVRKALLRALWPYLSRDETWEIFNRAAEDPEPGVAKGVVAIPADGMSPPTRQKHLQLLLQLLNHPAPEVRLTALQRCNHMPLQDPNNLLSLRLFELVLSPYDDECGAAIRAVFATYAKNQLELIAELYEELIKDRKLLIRVHDNQYNTNISPIDDKKYMRPIVHRILSVLKNDRLSVSRRVRLMFNGLPWEELKPYLFEIVPELTADALMEAKVLIQQDAWLANWKRASDDLTGAELEMAKSKDEKGRRLAVSLLIGSVGRNEVWTKEKKQRLERYRQDESVLVAEAAWDVELPREEVGEEEKDGGDTLFLLDKKQS